MATASTPRARPSLRSFLSFSVRARTLVALPGRARPLREVTMPLLLASSSTRPSGRLCCTVNCRPPSASTMRSPGSRVSRISGWSKGRKGISSVRWSERPSSSCMPLVTWMVFSCTTPRRILGPDRSCMMVMGLSSSFSTSRISLMIRTKSAAEPWEKFRRKTLTPASTS